MFKVQYKDVRRFIAKLLAFCLTVGSVPFGMIAQANEIPIEADAGLAPVLVETSDSSAYELLNDVSTGHLASQAVYVSDTDGIDMTRPTNSFTDDFPTNLIGEVFNDGLNTTIIKEVTDDSAILNENGKEIFVIKDEIGNIFVDGELFLSIEEVEPGSPNVNARTKWINGGTRKYSMDFVDKTRATAAALLAFIPGWGVAAAVAAEIALIWTSGKQLWFIEDTQVTSDGWYYRRRTRTFRKSNYTQMSKDTGWSSATRFHW